MFQYRQALARLRAGDTDRELARSGLMGREKVAAFRAIAAEQGWLAPDRALPEEGELAALLGQPRRARSTVSSVEPWRAQVTAWVEEGVQGTTIHAALKRNHGYTGSYSAVYRMIAGIHSAQVPEATVRLHFAPGEAAQVDFGAGPMLRDADGVERRTWAFVMTLCFSRHQYVEFVWDQSVATWLGCHRRAFEWFGAVPRRLIIDNAKCAITRACASDPLVQRAYGECALGYGFKIDPCPPHDPQKKGIVEAGVKFVKRGFLPLREIRDIADLNAQARQWVMNEAGERIHGTTRKAPLELFALERHTLLPLPVIAPDLGTWHRATLHRDCHLKLDTSLYSAPFTLVGQRLWIKVSDCSVAIFHHYQHLHTHPRAQRRGERITVRDHLPPDAAAFLAHDREYCLKQASAVGTACAAFISALFGDAILERLRSAQNVLRLEQTYGPARLEAACARALAFDTLQYRWVKNILVGGHDHLSLPSLAPAQAYAAAARFTRNAQDLFTAQPGRLQ
ncbi:MAG: IS21 family transposase [Rhodocyclaceae bacterium]|nr:IS21 family transposase [Rhodocyclaceae bacterium]MCA3113198.1 IS21 family transposase [Rhodocyclaceae bacterium]